MHAICLSTFKRGALEKIACPNGFIRAGVKKIERRDVKMK